MHRQAHGGGDNRWLHYEGRLSLQGENAAHTLVSVLPWCIRETLNLTMQHLTLWGSEHSQRFQRQTLKMTIRPSLPSFFLFTEAALVELWLNKDALHKWWWCLCRVCHFSPILWITSCKMYSVANMCITDSTDSGGQMSCDKVVTNVSWHQWAGVMFYYPAKALLLQSSGLIKTNCQPSPICSQVWSLSRADLIATESAHFSDRLFFPSLSLSWIYVKFWAVACGCCALELVTKIWTCSALDQTLSLPK